MPRSGRYNEISLLAGETTPDLRNRAIAFLESQKVDPSEFVFFEGKGFQLSIYRRKDSDVRRLKNAFSKTPHRGLRFKSVVLEKEDWFDKWKTEYRTMPFGDRFLVVPVWEAGKRPARQGKRSPIVIDPGCAFGSGMHETTRIMICLMERLEGRFGSFLDLGAGTGILSVAASRLGAGTVDMLEGDPPSMKAARANMKRNGCPVRSTWTDDLLKIKLKCRYDLTGANMISTTLLKAAKKIVGSVRPGGYLILSGIHRQNLKDFRKEFRFSRLKCLKVMHLRGWAGLLFRKAGHGK